MTLKWYKEQVLEAHLKDFYTHMRWERGHVLFQQDGAPSHTSKATERWLETYSISTFPQPANSPDLSPIEPVWHTLKSRICALLHTPTTLDQLKQAVRNAWEGLMAEDISKHTRCKQDRVDTILAARGGHTHF